MTTLLLVFGIAFVLSFVPLGFTIVRNYRKFRHPSVVDCPDGGMATVRVKAGRAAFSAAFRDDPRIPISSCSNWPGHEGCAQGCAEQVAASPTGNPAPTRA